MKNFLEYQLHKTLQNRELQRIGMSQSVQQASDYRTDLTAVTTSDVEQ